MEASYRYRPARVFNRPDKVPAFWRIPFVGKHVGTATVSLLLLAAAVGVAALGTSVGTESGTLLLLLVWLPLLAILVLTAVALVFINYRYNPDKVVREIDCAVGVIGSGRRRYRDGTDPIPL